jgi:predicted DNA-binding transcriptional regulator AlpA
MEPTAKAALVRLNAYTQPLMGLSELAGILGMTKQSVHKRLQKGRVPEPMARVSNGPVWLTSTIQSWLIEVEKIER